MTDRLAFWGSRLLARRAIRRRRGHRAAHLDLTPDVPPGRGTQSASGVETRPSDQSQDGKWADRTGDPTLSEAAARAMDPAWHYQLPVQYRLRKEFRPAGHRTVISQIREAARSQIGVSA